MTHADVPGGHVPVLLREVVEVLRPRADGIYVDGTFGGGGYTRAILAAAPCHVWAIDRDPAAVARGQAMAASSGGRLTMIPGNFEAMDGLLAARGIAAVDGVALDLGVSSQQIDDPARGFSFRADGPLDMRMGGEGPTAADVVNQAPEAELARIVADLGEERRARAVARAIVRARAEAPIATTAALADVVRRVVRPAADGIDPATRTFQALRIHVNDELGSLARGLDAAERLLAAGGRLAVVAFHSLEDRAVKRFLAERGGRAAQPSRHAPATIRPDATFVALTRKPVVPGADEVARNPRSRSARLRAAERTAAAPWRAAA